MKVAYLLGSLNRGGTETLLLDIFNQAETSHFEIVGVYRKEGDLIKLYNNTKVPLHKIETGRFWFLFHYLRKLRHVIKHEKPDIIHAQQNLDTLYAWLASLGLKIKVVQTFHGFDYRANVLNKIIIFLSLRMSDLNVFVSNTQYTYFLKTYSYLSHTRNAVIYNGINFLKFNKKTETSIRSELMIPRKILLIGMVGNFVRGRDQLTVCRFLKLLHLEGLNFTFLFIGAPDVKEPERLNACREFCLENGFSDKVKFLGARSDVPAILPELDAFIYSTEHDTFGLAVIEAIASGIPVFVNDWEVMNEITEMGKFAVVYRTKDESDLFSKFLSFLNQQENYKSLAEANAEWALKKYSINNHLEYLHGVYSTII